MPEAVAGHEALLDAGEALFAVRDALNQALEPQIKAKTIGHRREVAAKLVVPPALRTRLAPLADELGELLAVASVSLTDGAQLTAEVARTADAQCARCWRHRPDVGRAAAHLTLCVRCADVVGKAG
jgi:isoleucyl-tRNA synthetase